MHTASTLIGYLVSIWMVLRISGFSLTAAGRRKDLPYWSIESIFVPHNKDYERVLNVTAVLPTWDSPESIDGDRIERRMEQKLQGQKIRSTPEFLPNLVIAGAPKAGTSSLHGWLADHPDALGSTPKETYYFVDPGTHMHRPDGHITNGLTGYSSYFRPRSGQRPKVILESTPSYLYSETALTHLPDLPTVPKFIFVLREPAAQIYSQFNYFKSNWNWIPNELSFATYIDEIETSVPDYKGNELAANALRCAAYVDHLCRWRDRVGEERLRVWLFDDLKADPRDFARRAAEFAGLHPGFYDAYDFPRNNETYEVRSHALQKMNIALRGALPRGPLYETLRGLYRRLNTRKRLGTSSSDRAVQGRLKEHFAEANARLAAEFDLDLSKWR